MIRFGIVGTGWISRRFTEAAYQQGQWRLCGVLGSSTERAAEFLTTLPADAWAAVAHRSLDDLARSDVDVVYVATPNSLHFPVAVELLEHGKHVIVEKPAFSTSAEWTTAFETADRHGVLLLEAARHLYEDNYRTLRAAVLDLEAVTGASLVFRQHSSQFPAHLAGRRPRIFSAEFSGGALVDLGVYQLYAIVDWFGVPRDAWYKARILDTGADSDGVGVLRYPDFDVTFAISKAHGTDQPNEVYGPRGEVLAFNNVAGVEWLRRSSPPDAAQVVALAPPAANMLAPEVRHLTRRLLAFPEEPQETPYSYQELRKLGADVIALSEQLRRSAGVVFPADGARS